MEYFIETLNKQKWYLKLLLLFLLLDLFLLLQNWFLSTTFFV
jgi:hypothetical protein